MIEILDEEFFFLSKNEQIKFLENIFIKSNVLNKFKIIHITYGDSDRLKELEYDISILDCSKNEYGSRGRYISYLFLKIRHGSIFIDEFDAYRWYWNKYENIGIRYIQKYLIYLICDGFNLAEKENYNTTFLNFAGDRIFNPSKHESKFDINHLDLEWLNRNVPDSFSKLSLFEKNYKKAQLLL